MARCVFCKSHTETKACAYSKPGKWIRYSRVFTIPVCEEDRTYAEESFTRPFSDREMIKMWKEVSGA